MKSLHDLLTLTSYTPPVDAGALSTGFVDLDGAVGGWHPGDLILIADGEARPGLAFTLACHGVLSGALTDHVAIGMVSLRTSAHRLSQALVAVQARLPRHQLRQQQTTNAAVERARKQLRYVPITLCSLTATDVEELEETVMKLTSAHRLVVVHGLDHLDGGHRASPAHLLGRLKRLAHCLSVPILTVVPRPYLYLVEADIGLEIGTVCREDGAMRARVRIVANRHGQLGWVELLWDLATETLESADQDQ